MYSGNPQRASNSEKAITPRCNSKTEASKGEAKGAHNVHLVPVHELVLSDSPRLSGIDGEHVARLTECYAHLPPIVVHRQTMRVIDGAHRLQAAIRSGYKQVEVVYFDGEAIDAFILAVELNVRHGLPLSLPERRAAAKQILAAGTDLSDRGIAVKTGLSGKTVAAIRRSSGADIPHLNVRRGRDGRVYPVGLAGRRRAEQLLSANPGAPLREIASAAGVSPATVSAIRKQQRTGRDSAGSAPGYRRPRREVRQGFAGNVSPGPSGLRERRTARQVRDKKAVLAQLRSDPSMWGREAGRDLLRWLYVHAIGMEDLPECLEVIPPHCITLLATLAQQVGDAWTEFGRRLETLERQVDVS
jgi:ParB-like chromosome segregation protein Spo0J